MQEITRQHRQLALKVVEFYADRVKMTLLEQGELERAVAADLAKSDLQNADGAINRALDTWEAQVPMRRGPRVMVSGSQILEKQRAR